MIESKSFNYQLDNSIFKQNNYYRFEKRHYTLLKNVVEQISVCYEPTGFESDGLIIFNDEKQDLITDLLVNKYDIDHNKTGLLTLFRFNKCENAYEIFKESVNCIKNCNQYVFYNNDDLEVLTNVIHYTKITKIPDCLEGYQIGI